MANSSTCTKRRSAATRSISATASSGLCTGTRIEARSRGSRSSSSFATQSLTAEHSAIAMSSLNSATAPCSTLQMAKRRAERIERLAADHVEVAAGQPGLLPPVRPRAERRVRRIARQVEGVLVDVAVDELVAPVFVEIGQQAPRARRRRMKIAVHRAFDRHLHRRSSLAVCVRLRKLVATTIIREDRMFKHGHRAAAFALAVGLVPTAGHAQDIDILMALPAPTLTFSSAFIAEDAGFYKKEGLKVSTPHPRRRRLAQRGDRRQRRLHHRHRAGVPAGRRGRAADARHRQPDRPAAGRTGAAQGRGRRRRHHRARRRSPTAPRR